MGSININKSVFESIVRSIVGEIGVAPALPVFDYVIDIYSDKVVVTASDGTATTLNTVADLNDWLKNVRGKRIRINANVVVTQGLALTSNEYWIFGEWIRANVYVAESNTTIISFAPLGSGWEECYVTNMSMETGDYVDASGLKLFAVYADVDIEGGPTFTVNNISVCVLSSMYVFLIGVSGDVYAVSNWVYVFGAVLRRAFIYVLGTLDMENVEGMGYGSAWCIVSLFDTALMNVVIDDVDEVYICARTAIVASLPANTSQAYDLLSVTVTGSSGTLWYTVEAFGLHRSARAGDLWLDANEPPPQGVTYSMDLSTRSVTITNNTASPLDIVLSYRLEVHCWHYHPAM